MTADIDQPRTTAKLTLDGVRMGEQRRSRRTDIALQCVLRRAHGSPVTARTRDLGVGGMCVSTSRPLTIDERVRFELALHAGEHLAGHAREQLSRVVDGCLAKFRRRPSRLAWSGARRGPGSRL